MKNDFAARARALVGVRFRPQGRSEEGLDCLGLVLATYGIAADSVRRNYALRGDHLAEVMTGLAGEFRRVSHAAAGDLLLFDAGLHQLHFGIRTDRGFVHAHAGIGRVVETPGEPEWPVIGAYRRRLRKRKG